MRCSYHVGPFGWPEWLRILVIASFFGPLFLFVALLGYGAVAFIGDELNLYALPVGPELFDSAGGEAFATIIFPGLAVPLLVATMAAVIWEARWQREYRRPYWRERRDATRFVKMAKRRARVARLRPGWPVLWGNAFCVLSLILVLVVWRADLWHTGHGAIPAPAPTTVIRESPMKASTHSRAK